MDEEESFQLLHDHFRRISRGFTSRIKVKTILMGKEILRNSLDHFSVRIVDNYFERFQTLMISRPKNSDTPNFILLGENFKKKICK